MLIDVNTFVKKIIEYKTFYMKKKIKYFKFLYILMK